MSGKIKVKCIKENKYGFVLGKIYDAYTIKSPLKNKENMLSIVDDFGDEYAYPASFFEIVKD